MCQISFQTDTNNITRCHISDDDLQAGLMKPLFFEQY